MQVSSRTISIIFFFVFLILLVWLFYTNYKNKDNEIRLLPNDLSLVTLGQNIYLENCASCHEDEGLNLISLSSMTYLTQSELMYVLQKGKMRQQASHLSIEEKEAISVYLAQNEVLGNMTGSFNYKCTRVIEKRDLKQSSSWPSWGYDNLNSRNQPNSNINADNVKSLKLRWSFGISSQDVRAQPIVIGEVILLSESDSLHALNRKNGCTYWKFTSKARLRNAPVLNLSLIHI